MRAKKTLTAPALVLSILLLSVASRYIDPAVLGYGDQFYLSLIIMRLIIFVLPCIFYIKIGGPGYTFKLNLRFISPGRFGFILLALAVLITGSAAVKLLLTRLGVNATEFYGYESLAAITDATTLTDILYIITAFAVLPALTEELVFRSVILTEYNESGLGSGWSLILSSLLYSLIAFRPGMLILYIFIGIILSISVYVTRSVFAAFIIHLLYNLFNIFFEGYILRFVGLPENITLTSFIVISLFLFALVLMLGEAERLFHNDALTMGAEEDAPDIKAGGQHAFREAILSPTLLLCIVAFIAGVFL
ncbi:MAG: CPBP family intramembrane metalloprotease [Eubacteriales bacterium]|jgi:membrane protease YdiL (CAAX protease family)|nr:CPBP family intramembrane metalloprotease [Eubacteriales bacterium]